MSEAIHRLEEKIAYLEHHVTAQDKVILELADDLARLRRELKLLHDRVSTPGGEGGSGLAADDERPPHY
jgi:SlyX protein